MDIAKNVFQVHWVDGNTGEICRKKLPRGKVTEFFAVRPAGRIAMEACGGAHHWGAPSVRWAIRSNCCPRTRSALHQRQQG
jgi:transposase